MCFTELCAYLSNDQLFAIMCWYYSGKWCEILISPMERRLSMQQEDLICAMWPKKTKMKGCGMCFCSRDKTPATTRMHSMPTRPINAPTDEWCNVSLVVLTQETKWRPAGNSHLRQETGNAVTECWFVFDKHCFDLLYDLRFFSFCFHDT